MACKQTAHTKEVPDTESVSEAIGEDTSMCVFSCWSIGHAFRALVPQFKWRITPRTGQVRYYVQKPHCNAICDLTPDPSYLLGGEGLDTCWVASHQIFSKFLWLWVNSAWDRATPLKRIEKQDVDVQLLGGSSLRIYFITVTELLSIIVTFQVWVSFPLRDWIRIIWIKNQKNIWLFSYSKDSDCGGRKYIYRWYLQIKLTRIAHWNRFRSYIAKVIATNRGNSCQ
jgi:hypothetical protein